MDDFDAVILACTHYPLAARSFARALGPARLFDPAVAVAERVRKQLREEETGGGATRFLISKDSQTFRDRVANLPFGNVSIEVVD